jgi:hypothetical protein
LRVLDAGGEYQRLGDARRRRADVRVKSNVLDLTDAVAGEIGVHASPVLPSRPTREYTEDEIREALARHRACAIVPGVISGWPIGTCCFA